MHDVSIPLLAFSAALVVSLFCAPILIRSFGTAPGAGRRRLGEGPPPVPRVGGVSVLAGLVAGVGVALWSSDWSGTLFRATQYQWIGWILAGGALFLWGLVDDLRGLSPRAKLFMQLAGGLVAWVAGFRIDALSLPGLGVWQLGWVGLPVTILWVVAVVNAFNFIDGLDGLAAGVALISTTTVALISFLQGIFPVTVISAALAGSLVGFLRFNRNPARITLGDSGSQLLGFTLAVVSMRGLVKSATAVAVLAPVLVLGLPILDMGLVVLRRVIRRGEDGEASAESRLSRWSGLARRDREHIHHNLLDLGLSDRAAAFALYVASAAFCAASACLVVLERPALMALVAASAAAGIAVTKVAAVRLRAKAPYERPRADSIDRLEAATASTTAPSESPSGRTADEGRRAMRPSPGTASR